MVEQAVGDAGLLRDVADAGGVVALAGEDAYGGCQDEAPLFRLGTGTLGQGRRTLVVPSSALQPLAGQLVVDLTRYLPGAYASRELLRLGARVVRLEPPGGEPMRAARARPGTPR